MDIDSLIKRFIIDNNKYAFETKQAYKRFVQEFFTIVQLDPKDIDKDMINNYLIELSRQGLSARSIRTKASGLKSFFSYLQEEEIINTNPTLLIDLPRDYSDYESTIISENEVLKIKYAARNNLRDRVIIDLLLDTGVRVSELIGIKIKDLKLHKTTIWLGPSKNREERYVFYTFETADRLKRYLGTRKDDSPFLFVNKKYQPFTRQGIYKMFKNYLKKTEIKKEFSLHSCRRTFITNLLEKGFDTNQVILLAGQKRAASLEPYAKTTTEWHQRKFDEYYVD